MNKNDLEMLNSLSKRREALMKHQEECEALLMKYKYDPPKDISASKTFYPKGKNHKKKLKPLNINKSISTYERRKNYHINAHKISRAPTKYQTKVIPESIVMITPTGKKVADISYNQYLQLQTKADLKLRPVKGECSPDLINFINQISEIRKKVIAKDIDPIFQAEDTYNTENPGEDSKINLEDKALIEHLWKNYFTLGEYQNFLLDKLKGKISNLNYRTMLKNFKQISQICFAKGVVNIGQIKYNLGQQY